MKRIIKTNNIQDKIHTIRSIQVIMDKDLAELYNVETRALKQAVKRNIKRFPADFMFELTKKEIDFLVSQSVIPSIKALGGAKPFVFTEQGVSALSGVLTSSKAIEVNITIIRAFVAMRKFIAEKANVLQRLDKMELKQINHDKKFNQIFKALENKTIKPKQGIFYDGQIFDAYLFVSDLIKSGFNSISFSSNDTVK